MKPKYTRCRIQFHQRGYHNIIFLEILSGWDKGHLPKGGAGGMKKIKNIIPIRAILIIVLEKCAVTPYWVAHNA